MARREEQSNIGEDSFLDTIANLVGILIILVVLIGGKTKVDAEAKSRQIAEQDVTDQALEPAAEAQRLREAALRDQEQLQYYALETEYRRLERDKLLEQAALMREKIAERISKVDQHEREQIEKSRERERLEGELKDISDQLGAAQETKRTKITLEHLPTPMAKTVFSRELHIRLKNRRVTVVPWDRLVATLKEHAPLAARRSASKKTLDDKLGPISGFMLHYRMSAIPGGFELDRFEIDVTPENVGQTLDEALSTAGILRGELSSRVPAETVVTVWVYPDSFAEFRQLKSALYREGFLAAARPLPEDILIGASPRGSRSAAQ
ncbi:MAG: hypothetical protein ACTHOU_20080 [Aureliella sp.]